MEELCWKLAEHYFKIKEQCSTESDFNVAEYYFKIKEQSTVALKVALPVNVKTL